MCRKGLAADHRKALVRYQRHPLRDTWSYHMHILRLKYIRPAPRCVTDELVSCQSMQVIRGPAKKERRQKHQPIYSRTHTAVRYASHPILDTWGYQMHTPDLKYPPGCICLRLSDPASMSLLHILTNKLNIQTYSKRIKRYVTIISYKTDTDQTQSAVASPPLTMTVTLSLSLLLCLSVDPACLSPYSPP